VRVHALFVGRERKRTYRVAELAKLSGLSVRALHHYDAIGLLVPTARSASGYRLYDETAVLRLQQILIGRELGLALEEIRRSLDDPRFDLRATLRDQREKLATRARRAREMIAAIDRALALIEDAKETDMKELFVDPHEEETRARWGDTDAYRVSRARAKGYGRAEWDALRAEQGEIYDAARRAKESGAPADADVAMDVAERHRLSIDRWFYPCSYAMHDNLADLYEADERFAASIDAYGAGLTPYLSAAIRANAARNRR